MVYVRSTITYATDECSCGSGLTKHDLTDARGIFCGYVCSECEKRKRDTYNADIFENTQYETDETIEPEDY